MPDRFDWTVPVVGSIVRDLLRLSQATDLGWAIRGCFPRQEKENYSAQLPVREGGSLH